MIKNIFNNLTTIKHSEWAIYFDTSYIDDDDDDNNKKIIIIISKQNITKKIVFYCSCSMTP